MLSGQWNGPDLEVHGSCGFVCMFPQGTEKPVWVSESLTRPVEGEWKGSRVSTEASPEENTMNRVRESSSQERSLYQQ